MNRQKVFAKFGYYVGMLFLILIAQLKYLIKYKNNLSFHVLYKIKALLYDT